MSGRGYQVVSNMELDEVSLVDRPANPHAAIVIAKSYQGDAMPDLPDSPTGYYWEDGTPVAEDDEIGAEDTVYDANGDEYGLDADAIAEIENAANEREPVEVGKGALFGRQTPPAGPVQKSLAEQLSEQLKSMVSKGAGEGDTELRSLVTKAVDALAAQETRTAEAESIAKSEREIRLTREFIAKAESYGEIPGVKSDDLGRVIKNCAQLLPEADCIVLDTIFKSTGDTLFKELGRTGGGTNGLDPMSVVEAAVEGDGQIQKSANGQNLSKAERTTAYLAEHPEAYDEYLATRYDNQR